MVAGVHDLLSPDGENHGGGRGLIPSPDGEIHGGLLSPDDKIHGGLLFLCRRGCGCQLPTMLLLCGAMESS
jgi:hypothetical protein